MKVPRKVKKTNQTNQVHVQFVDKKNMSGRTVTNKNQSLIITAKID